MLQMNKYKIIFIKNINKININASNGARPPCTMDVTGGGDGLGKVDEEEDKEEKEWRRRMEEE